MQRNLDAESLEVEVLTMPSKELWAMKALEVETWAMLRKKV